MNRTHRLAYLVAMCGIAMAASAQDSVSPAGALPGDALSAYDTNEICNAYVVDMTPLTGSWGTALQVGPVVKAVTLPNSLFYNNLISAHAISKDAITAANYPAQSYALWNTPGAGINDLINTAPGSISPSGASVQIAAAFADFGTTGAGASYNGIHGAVINYDPMNDSRMYVYRANTAINGADETANSAQMGMGVVDANGNVHFRVDDFGVSGPNPIVGQNIFRTNMLARDCNVLNVIDNAGASDAASSTWLVQRSGTTHVVPNAIAESIAGRPVYGGVNFNGEYVYEVVPGIVTATTAHQNGATDMRGVNGSSMKPWFFSASAVATYANMAKTAGADTDAMSVWDVDADGNVVGGTLLTLPSAPGQGGSITDNNDGYVIGGPGGWDFDGYHSQTPFRGGTGSVALTVDADGKGLVAADAYDNLIIGSDNPSNAVVVGKYDQTTGTTAWTLAAYYDSIADVGKAILDGPGGNVIGQMTGMFKVTGGAPLGPSISVPAFDCKGNVYFVGAVEIFGDTGSDFDVALVRAVYDPATFSYQLELLAQGGDTFTGVNSGTPYQITFIDLADFNSLSSGSFFSSNVVQDCWSDLDPADLADSMDSRALGGLVLNSRITYDTDGDGLFDNTLDENYRVLLLVAGTNGESDPCAYADYNNDGSVNTQDFITYLNDWSNQIAMADCDGDGNINTADFICFLNLWANCR